MVVQSISTPPVEPPEVEAPDAGVIEEARARQRRYRRAGAGALLALALAGVVAYFAVDGGGGAAKADGNAAAVPRASGSVHFVSLRTPGIGLLVAPNLRGRSSTCVTAFEGGGGQSSCGLYPLPQAGLPLELATTYYNPRGTAGNRVPPGGYLYLVLTAPDVASVRVGDLGTIKVQSAPGLPPGDHAVAFRETARSIGTVVPPGTRPAWIRRYLHGSPAVVLTALDRSGRPVPSSLTGALRQFFAQPFHRPANTTTSAADSRCAIAESLPGLAVQSVVGVTKIAADPVGGPGSLLSCLWETYAFEGKRFQVAILLNATAPGSRPGTIWDATPVPGHPGIAMIHAPSAPDNELVARRVGNAWIVAAPWVGFPGWPTLRQCLQVLAAVHITRIDLGHS